MANGRTPRATAVTASLKMARGYSQDARHSFDFEHGVGNELALPRIPPHLRSATSTKDNSKRPSPQDGQHDETTSSTLSRKKPRRADNVDDDNTETDEAASIQPQIRDDLQADHHTDFNMIDGQAGHTHDHVLDLPLHLPIRRPNGPLSIFTRFFSQSDLRQEGLLDPAVSVPDNHQTRLALAQATQTIEDNLTRLQSELAATRETLAVLDRGVFDRTATVDHQVAVRHATEQRLRAVATVARAGADSTLASELWAPYHNAHDTSALDTEDDEEICYVQMMGRLKRDSEEKRAALNRAKEELHRATESLATAEVGLTRFKEVTRTLERNLVVLTERWGRRVQELKAWAPAKSD